ncbi:hypothetical protein SSIL_3338 [Solibacillus silvestris StLB046]|uniref:Pesticidal crystal protein Cry22Aa Ig-like domain-containing protein n=1 Tax=Solibacillus silvestris (strain StLB046) TaxID=1002809 RepID=F2F3W3_SOLSS|nr:DUF5011 domain-containing protein [Solibacillus silvestris]BAK17761.1 hypothetical protein SSIL_3338 [Solibacillus silvestris StLB046]
MKKLISILMIFLLIISTIGPLPTPTATAETVDFPGSVSESTTETGTIIVTMNETGYTLTLHKHPDNSSGQAQVGTAITNYDINEEKKFTGVAPGLYIVRATKSASEGKPAVVKTSDKVQITPAALSVGTSGSFNIISPATDPYKLEITGLTGQKVRLYNNDSNTLVRELPVTTAGTVTFDTNNGALTFPAGSKYQVTQIVDGAESLKSTYITVQPNTVVIEKVDGKDSGPNNDAGQILVKNTKSGNTLELLRDGTVVDTRTASSTEYTFTALAAGSYRVRQIENGVASKEPSSNLVMIKNEQIPNISLNAGENYAIRYTIDATNKVTKMLYNEPGYTVSYKNGKVYTGTTAKTFCEESVTTEAGDTACTPVLKIEISGQPTIAGEAEKYTPPGKYTITYKATDLTDLNLTSTVVRNITVYPNKVNLSSVNTDPTLPNDTTGELKVHGVFAGAKLSLFQRLADGSIEQVPVVPERLNEGEYTFKNIPVGDNYYVVQEVNGVASDSSEEVDIKDDTPPVLKLTGEPEITLEVGDRYEDAGATATDNITPSSELDIITAGTVNTSMPGVYTITYNVTDKAGNRAVTIARTVKVKPRPVTAIGGIATTGEIGVKDIFPGVVDRKTTVTLYKFDTDSGGNEVITRVATRVLTNNEITFVLRKYGPGRYYVTQTVNGQESRQSNIVEIVDTDRPYITLNGVETVQLVYGEAFLPYYDGTKFIDPGANADDYLEANELRLKAILVGPNNTPIGLPTEAIGRLINFPDTVLPVPGMYKITYSATAPRGSTGDNKHRKIELAPPKVTGVLAGKAGEGKINVINGLFEHASAKTTVTLYNSYGQKMQSQTINTGKTAHFTDVPAGLGYYVTQTVNGIESAPSISVNVSLFNEAPASSIISSFEFESLKAVGAIDHTAGTITVTVPKGTDRTKLAPVIKTNNDPVNTITVSPLSGVAQNFMLPVTYTVTTNTVDKTISKTYIVTVVEAAASSDMWTGAVQKNIAIGTNSHYTLTANEKAAAIEKGIAFLSNDLSIYIPAPNIIESKVPTLSIQQPAVSTIYRSADPAWAKSITNPVEVQWGGESSFYQPIEMELNNATGKVFSKLVRNAKNELYAIVQPSYKASGKTVGLVSEPGLYALIDDVAKPYIQELGNGSYRIYPMTPGSAIYYTTNSRHISYDKSASLKAGNYSLNHSDINLEQWNTYTDYETLTISGNELYAVAVKDQIISPVSIFQSVSYSSWSRDVKQVEANKIWHVKFNARVEKKALYNDSIYVTDDSTGGIVPTKLVLGSDGQSIDVVPAVSYSRNKHYTLWVTKQIKGNTINKQFLGRPTKLTFTVK